MSAIGMMGEAFLVSVFVFRTREDVAVFFVAFGGVFLALTTLAARLEAGGRAVVEAAFFMNGSFMIQEWQNC